LSLSATRTLSALAVSAGCARRPFPAMLMDFVAQIRNLIGEISSRFLPARRCDQHTDSYAAPHSNGQRNGCAEYVGFFFAARCVGGTTDAVGHNTDNPGIFKLHHYRHGAVVEAKSHSMSEWRRGRDLNLP
jgi:hypothetical protein